MKSLPLLNPEDVSEEELSTYSQREAARAVVVDENNLVALMRVTSENYYKLPGGGIEAGEDPVLALARECDEELGCKVEILSEIGSMIEYRRPNTEKQTNYCYFAKVIGEKGLPNFSPKELSQGFEAMWLPYSEALAKISESKPITKEGEYIVSRDKIFLLEVKNNF